MSKKFPIFIIIFLIIFSFLFFNFGKTEKGRAMTVGVEVARMKTRTDGYFYVPVTNPPILKVDRLFNNPDIEGDQTGPLGEPDGKVETRDDALIAKFFGTVEGGARWDYMADISPDRKIDTRELAIIAKNFGNVGNYIIDLTDVTIEFRDSLMNIISISGLDPDNMAQIPAGAANFTVMKDLDGPGGNPPTPIGAYIHFYAKPFFDFLLSNSGNITVTPGGSGSNTITIDYVDGSGTTVTLSVSGLPAGATAGFSPSNSCTADCTLTLTISTIPNISSGTYPNITVTGTGDGIKKTTTFDLIVTAIIPPPVVCIPNGCNWPNGVCPVNCTVADDPDCGCQDNNGCCGIGCNITNDNDCPPPPLPPQPPPTPPGRLPNPFVLVCGSVEECIEVIINFIFWVTVAITPLMIIVAAFYFLTSAGDPERVRTAKRIIFWTVIGFTIVLLARGIISLVRQILGG